MPVLQCKRGCQYSFYMSSFNKKKIHLLSSVRNLALAEVGGRSYTKYKVTTDKKNKWERNSIGHNH